MTRVSRSRAQAAAIARESGGSPLFVYELVAYLQSGDGLTELPSSADDISLDYMLRRRLSRVPAETARLLEIMAVSGQPLLEVDAYAAADLPRRDPGILAFLRSARLVRTRGSGDATAVEIYHDRIRETLVASLDADVRRHCHHRLALTLQASGRAQPDTLAVHFFGAGDLATAGHYYLTAADAAADAMAFDRAAEYYRQALNLRRPVGAESRRSGPSSAARSPTPVADGRRQKNTVRRAKARTRRRRSNWSVWPAINTASAATSRKDAWRCVRRWCGSGRRCPPRRGRPSGPWFVIAHCCD